MRILAVDIGTGTQDILLFDSQHEIENCFKLVMPSPTIRIAGQIRQATTAGEDLLLTGVIMGGGPCAWAMEKHVRAGFRVYATSEAARTFDDELEKVAAQGVILVSEDEAAALAARVRHLVLQDLDIPAIRQAFSAFGVEMSMDALAVAVFDHGNAPPGYSDRRFRFDYLEERLRLGQGLSGFGFWAGRIPARFTRLQAVAATAQAQAAVPAMVMDTGPAAILGALEDPVVRHPAASMVVNVGNFHTLAFNLFAGQVIGVFEHHTGELTQQELVTYLHRLAGGVITNQEVFDDMGHGAIVLQRSAEPPEVFAITGPRRGLLQGASLPLYQAVPHGDMMLAGCFGLLRAYASLDPARAPEITRILDGGQGSGLW
ncbi:MAG: pyruvate formate lyase-activating protein [Chloroflexi bacterium]|nr:pyruvate formate lyase-activating protein [Chloroflexota bacterium]